MEAWPGSVAWLALSTHNQLGIKDAVQYCSKSCISFISKRADLAHYIRVNSSQDGGCSWDTVAYTQSPGRKHKDDIVAPCQRLPSDAYFTIYFSGHTPHIFSFVCHYYNILCSRLFPWTLLLCLFKWQWQWQWPWPRRTQDTFGQHPHPDPDDGFCASAFAIQFIFRWQEVQWP